MKTNCSPSTSRTAFHHVFAYLLMVALIAFAFPRSGNSQTIKDIATNATDPSNLADTEPSIAVDPSNPLRIAVVSFSEPWGASVMAPVWKSTDRGADLDQGNPNSPTFFQYCRARRSKGRFRLHRKNRYCRA